MWEKSDKETNQVLIWCKASDTNHLYSPRMECVKNGIYLLFWFPSLRRAAPPSAIQLRKCKVIELMKTRPCYGVKCNCTHIRSVETPGQDYSTPHRTPHSSALSVHNETESKEVVPCFCVFLFQSIGWACDVFTFQSLRFVAQRWDGHLSCPAPSAPPRTSYKQITPARISTWENL